MAQQLNVIVVTENGRILRNRMVDTLDAAAALHAELPRSFMGVFLREDGIPENDHAMWIWFDQREAPAQLF